MKFSRELIKGSTKSLILAVLLEGELYGYQIVKAIREKSDEELAFGEVARTPFFRHSFSFHPIRN